MHFDLVDLRLMVRVAESNSLTRGAEASHISLPAASTRIKNLEESIGAKLIERANHRFRQGPPPVSINEQIRMKAECFHWLGKARDLADKPATAQYLLSIFFDDVVSAFFRLRGFWLTAPAEAPKFMASRDAELGDLAGRFLTAGTLPERLNFGRDLADILFKDVPNPARID